MARYSGKKGISEETREEAARIARGTRQPGQTKEQTKLIAQGIQKGIDLYKKQLKAKQRDVSRRQRKAGQGGEEPLEDTSGDDDHDGTPSRGHSWLPWTLLLLTWAGLGAAVALGRVTFI